MLASEKEKRQSIGSKVEAMKSILEVATKENRELTAEECKKFDSLDKEVSELQDALGITVDGKGSDRENRVSALENKLSQIMNPHHVRTSGVTATANPQRMNLG